MVVTADDLARIGTRVPEFFTGDLFCPVGRTPIYLGQPVALLIFEEFDAFDQARHKLRDDGFVKFAEGAALALHDDRVAPLCRGEWLAVDLGDLERIDVDVEDVVVVGVRVLDRLLLDRA